MEVDTPKTSTGAAAGGAAAGAEESKASSSSSPASASSPSAGGAVEAKTGEQQASTEGVTEGEEGAGAAPASKEPEPSSFTLGNPARVTLAQEPLVSFELSSGSQRYVPVRKAAKPVGIVMLTDRRPEEPEDVAAVESPPLEGDEDEADPPAPFEWTAPTN